jgi:hypothetical protein
MGRIRSTAFAATALAAALGLASPEPAKASGAVKCGDTLTLSVKLTRDLTNCPGNGLVIGAAGITVDLDGHTIDGTVTQITDCDVSPFGVAGIDNSGGYDRLTVKNGTLQQFFSGFNAGSETTGMSDSSLYGLTARDNRFSGIAMGSAEGRNDGNRIVGNHAYGNGCRAGIVLNTARGNLIAHNRSHDNGAGILVCCGDENVVRSNRVAHNAHDGIVICCDGRDNLVDGNAVLDNTNNGILVFFGAGDTLIRGNRVTRNGDDIVIDETAGNRVVHNLVTDALGCPFCAPPTGFGIAVVGAASDNLVAGNVIARTKDDGIRVLDFDPPARCRAAPWCARTSSAPWAWTGSASTPGPTARCSSVTSPSARATMGFRARRAFSRATPRSSTTTSASRRRLARPMAAATGHAGTAARSSARESPATSHTCAGGLGRRRTPASF